MAPKFYATDSDIFQVTRETKATVTVRPVRTDCTTTRIRSAFDFDQLHKARADDFTTSFLFDDRQNANGKRCKILRDGSICINSYWGVYAYPSDGAEEQTRDLG